MPTPVPGVAGPGPGLGRPETTSTSTSQLDRDAFLKLMVAQLKYQNPLSPADPESMLAQTAQFSTVEKLEQLTSLLAESGRAQRLATGSALIGKEVVAATGADGETVSGVVTGASRTADDVVLLRLAVPGGGAASFEVALDDVQQVR